MTERPSQTWSRDKAEQQTMVAAGTLRPDETYALSRSPAYITGVDQALATYEQQINTLPAPPADDQIWAAVETAVEAINELDEDIDTVDREDLAEYLDVVLTEAGIDVTALTGRRGLDRSELTDQWRDW